MFQQPSQGDQVKIAELLGCLVLIWVRELREEIQTAYGPSDAIAADLHVLDGAKGGEKFENTLIFQKALIGSLRGAIGGEPVLGRISQGIAKPGQSAPYILTSFTDADAAVATGYIQRMAKPFQAPASPNPNPPAAAAAQPGAASASGQTVDISTLPPEVQELLRQQGQLTG
jgi:hypothetical protein